MMGKTHAVRRHRLSALLIVVILNCLSSQAQEHSQYDRGTPPQHSAGVSSFGSYTSADIGNINLGNGGLSFNLPLGQVGGRGFTVPITLNYSSKLWSASRGVDFDNSQDSGPVERPVVYASYGEGDNSMDLYHRLGPGWTIGAQPLLKAHIIEIGQIPNSCVPAFKLTKLTLVLPDKGEIELRDDQTDGAPIGVPQNSGCGYRDGYRGPRWHAADGSGLIYISDHNNGPVAGFLAGVVITSDGTRYRFENFSGSPFGIEGLSRCHSITDRNGNRITIEYPAGLNEVRYTDQLGRATKIQWNVPDPANPSVNVDVLVTLNGYGGQPRYYKILLGSMNAHYRAGINPTLPVGTGLKDCDFAPHNYHLMPMGTALFPESWGKYVQYIDQELIVRELVLPDGRSLRFKYNQFGEVAEVQLPTGGKVQYDYGPNPALPSGNSFGWEQAAIEPNMVSAVWNIDRALTARRTYPDGSTLEGTWTYTYGTETEVKAFVGATGTLLLRQKHYFLPANRYLNLQAQEPDGTGYVLWSTGVERRVETLDASGAILSASEQDWSQRAPLVWNTGYAQEQPANDNRVNEERQILDTGALAKVQTSYDLFNNPTEVKEYDFDQTLKRRTVTSYSSTNLVNGVNYAGDSIRLLRLPLQQSIYDGASSEQARTVTGYDIYTNDGNHFWLEDYDALPGNISGHDTGNYGLSKVTRGNATSVKRWHKSSNTYISTYPRYDILGNVVSTKDPRGFVSTVSFSDDFGNGSNPGSGPNNPATATFALPTLFTSPDPGNGSGSHTARSQYDFSTGLLTGFKDRNNIVTQTIYNDPFNRPTLIKAALGVTLVETHTAMFYAPATAFGITLAKNDVLTASDQNTLDDGVLRSWTVTDGFGRTKEAWSRDPQGDIKVITNYDALGRTSQTSNPFRPSLGESALYTTTTYDLVGRVRTVTTPDNSVVTTDYSGNTVTVTDQITKKRKSVTDALGRLKEIYEDPLGVNYQTTYDYDVLDNLIKVTQGTQQRFFKYDSLKRLIRARNPEQNVRSPQLDLSDPLTGNSQWCMAYEYDNNGNLTQKTDARGVISIYAYDALNRNTTIDYSDATPDSFRQYDQAINGKGRLNQVWQSGTITSATYIDSYDALGRPLSQRQRYETGGVWSSSYRIQRAYNLAGGVTSQTYPSGRKAIYNYDTAGRLADKDAQNLAFTGNLGDGVQRTYSRGIIYSSLGGMAKEQFGTDTPIFNKAFYNSRGQLSEIRVGTTFNSLTDGGWERGAIINHYSNQCWGACNGTDNNGNLKAQDHWIPNSSGGVQAIFSQTYTYDNLNRLLRAQEGNWQQEYVYDRWGNRTIHQTNTWGTGINKKDFTVNTANNRLGVPGGQSGAMSYDLAGNLTNDTYTGAGSREYDAENRMTKAWGGNNQWQEYTYNADGQRVRRKIDGIETRQIYGMDGELLAEYAANAGLANPQKEYGYRNGELLVTAEPSRANVALAANGGTASASSFLGPPNNLFPSYVNDGARTSINGGIWLDNTYQSWPDWIQIDFNGSKTINEIDVITQQDDYQNPIEPTLTQMFSLYGITAFNVQYWNGSAWTTVSGGSVTGNNKVWRQFTFAPVTTSKIRVLVNAGADNTYSRVVEVEAWEAPPVNYALPANGGMASASSYLGPPNNLFPSYVNDGARTAITGNIWLDNTYQGWPDWIQIDFNGSKTISEIDVITQQDNYQNPVEPTLAQTFSLYGITAFDVQYWNGSAWVTVPGGSVTGNNKVWRQFTFAPITTSKIRVLVNAGADNTYSRVVELEAWNTPSVPSSVNLSWLVADQLGTPRIILNKTGSLATTKRHDYLPFGEELFAGIGGRTTTLGYTGDTIRQKFTQYERDNETGLDFAQARYYANSQGRFVGVDPLIASAQTGKPQSWNRYAYCINNPLIFVDRSGLIWGVKSNGNGIATAQWFETEEEMRKEKFDPMTNFLARNPHGDGYISFDRFSSHYEYVSSFAVWGGMVNGSTSARQLGFTSRSWPLHLMFDGVPNAVDYLYRTPTAQGLLNSQEAHFLSIYSGVAGVEFAAAQGFATLRGVSMQGLAYDLTQLGKHLPGSRESTALLSSGNSAHVFNDLTTLSRVESEIFSRGVYTGSQRGFLRFGLRFDKPIGTRIGPDGTKTALDYGELKLRGNMYHLDPRTGPARGPN